MSAYILRTSKKLRPLATRDESVSGEISNPASVSLRLIRALVNIWETQALSLGDRKIVDWDVKPQYKQTNEHDKSAKVIDFCKKQN